MLQDDAASVVIYDRKKRVTWPVRCSDGIRYLLLHDEADWGTPFQPVWDDNTWTFKELEQVPVTDRTDVRAFKLQGQHALYYAYCSKPLSEWGQDFVVTEDSIVKHAQKASKLADANDKNAVAAAQEQALKDYFESHVAQSSLYSVRSNCRDVTSEGDMLHEEHDLRICYATTEFTLPKHEGVNMAKLAKKYFELPKPKKESKKESMGKSAPPSFKNKLTSGETSSGACLVQIEVKNGVSQKQLLSGAGQLAGTPGVPCVLDVSTTSISLGHGAGNNSVLKAPLSAVVFFEKGTGEDPVQILASQPNNFSHVHFIVVLAEYSLLHTGEFWLPYPCGHFLYSIDEYLTQQSLRIPAPSLPKFTK